MADETQVETPEPAEAPDVTPETTEQVVEAPAEPEVKPHPAHEKLLAELPEAWHQKVLPHLQEQDKYFQQELEKYTPYKEFVEDGISPDVIRGGVNLAKAIEMRPMEVYESLTGFLREQGLLAEEAKAAAKEIMEDESGEDLENLFDGQEIPAALKKELDELKNMTQQQQEYLQNQQLEAETQKELQALEQGMANLKSKYQISEAHEIAIYDIMNAALNGGREVTLEEAAQQLSGMIPGGLQSATQKAAAEPAPTVIGSAGGAGIQAQNLEVPKDDDAKRAMLANMFEQYKKAAQ